MLVASVIVDVSARAIARAFDYLVPEELAEVQVGCAVSVDFGNRPVVGYVVALREAAPDGGAGDDAGTEDVSDGGVHVRGTSSGVSPRAVGHQLPMGLPWEESPDDTSRPQDTSAPDIPLEKLRPLLGILSEPYFDEPSTRLASWIAREYLCPLPDALHLFTPPGGSPKMKRVNGEWMLVFPGVGPVDDRWVFLTDEAATFKPPKNAAKQRKVLAALANGGMRVPELSLELGAVNATLKALEKRGVVRIEHRRRMRAAMKGSIARDVVLRELTAGQQEALGAIEQAMSTCRASASGTKGAGCPPVVVVDGITGSGKTEVYLRAIAQTLEAGKSAIVLVPEIALTPQTVGRFRARFGDDVAVLHSKLSVGERFDQWDLVRCGGAHVAVGTRSALFAPVHDLGLVIIDEEHDGSYKQDSAPRYSAREVAVQLCALRGAVLALGSATPDICTLTACGDRGASHPGWRRVELPERPGGQALPEVTVVDMGREFKGGSRSMFSAELVEALVQVHDRKEKAVLLLNRRGFASFVLCRECGFVPECPNCAVSLTYHERGNYLACHHCDCSIPSPPRCPECGSPYLRKFGTGTERVEAELHATVPTDMPIVRMDADTVKGKGGHEKLLEEFGSLESGILLGTQMIAKGLDYPDVTLVGVINADTTLKLPDYRAPECTYQLLEQVSGRAGRADKPGRVIVQTYWPEHPAIQAAASHDRALFLEEELLLRRELAYPPFARLANVLVWGRNEQRVRQQATELTLAVSSALQSAGESWTLLGPAPCVLGKLRGVYRWHILLKAPPGADFAHIMEPVLAKRKRKRDDDTRVAVDVDPTDLL